jgi:hypothetical protein
MPGYREFHGDTLDSGRDRGSAGGVDGLRHCISGAGSIWAASIPRVNCDRVGGDAVRFRFVGLQARRVALCVAWSARGCRRGAVLSGAGVGPAAAAAVSNRPRTQGSRRRGRRAGSSAAEKSSIAFGLNSSWMSAGLASEIVANPRYRRRSHPCFGASAVVRTHQDAPLWYPHLVPPTYWAGLS